MPNLQTFERSAYQQVKADLHRKILDRLDLEKLGRTASDTAREEVLILIRNSVNGEAVPLSFAERERLSREILDEIFGPAVKTKRGPVLQSRHVVDCGEPTARLSPATMARIALCSESLECSALTAWIRS